MTTTTETTTQAACLTEAVYRAQLEGELDRLESGIDTTAALILGWLQAHGRNPRTWARVAVRAGSSEQAERIIRAFLDTITLSCEEEERDE